MAHVMTQENRRMEEFLVGGSTTEALGGVGVVVLSILGLAGIAPHLMLAISAIALGVAFLSEGGAVAAQYSHILKNTMNTRIDAVELGGGMSADAIAGAASVVLGILALLNVAPAMLTAVATIVLGVGLMMASGVTARIDKLKVDMSDVNETARWVAHEALMVSMASALLVGGSAVVLGILSVIGLDPVTLSLVALLAMGSTVALKGGSLAAWMLTLFGK